MLILSEDGVIVLQTILLQESSVTVDVRVREDVINDSERGLTYPLAWISVSITVSIQSAVIITEQVSHTQEGVFQAQQRVSLRSSHCL